MILAGVLSIGLAGYAVAGADLEEYHGVPFTLAAHDWLDLEVLPTTAQPSYRLAAVMPPQITDLAVIELEWPGSDEKCNIGVGIEGLTPGQYGSASRAFLAVAPTGNDAELVPGMREGTGGVTRMCIWPTAKDQSADLVVVYSVASNMQDAAVMAFKVSRSGAVTEVSTSNANTLFGWFDVRDVNRDDSYELITSRNLDGMWGGFFYHSVRSFDPALNVYAARPEGCEDYFRQELAWLDWVIQTQPLIQQDPGKYLNETGSGPAYMAVYNGVAYGFDSIIEVPLTFTGVGDVREFNRQRRESFQLIKDYHDELEAWLNGGSYPATWKLAR